VRGSTLDELTPSRMSLIECNCEMDDSLATVCFVEWVALSVEVGAEGGLMG
jgi:hypothetical protein